MDSVRLYSLERLEPEEYQIFKANVIKNSLNRVDNYITLDEGSSAGIRPEMGVVDANGVVGIVYKTSPHYSSLSKTTLTIQTDTRVCRSRDIMPTRRHWACRLYGKI